MPDPQLNNTPADPEIPTDEVDAAETAALAAQAAANAHKSAWLTEKTSMIDWLKTYVGDSIDQNVKDLRDTVIASAEESHRGALQILWQTRNYLEQITKNPEVQVTITDGPRADDNTSKQLPVIDDGEPHEDDDPHIVI